MSSICYKSPQFRTNDFTQNLAKSYRKIQDGALGRSVTKNCPNLSTFSRWCFLVASSSVRAYGFGQLPSYTVDNMKFPILMSSWIQNSCLHALSVQKRGSLTMWLSFSEEQAIQAKFENIILYNQRNKFSEIITRVNSLLFRAGNDLGSEWLKAIKVLHRKYNGIPVSSPVGNPLTGQIPNWKTASIYRPWDKISLLWKDGREADCRILRTQI